MPEYPNSSNNLVLLPFFSPTNTILLLIVQLQSITKSYQSFIFDTKLIVMVQSDGLCQKRLEFSIVSGILNPMIPPYWNSKDDLTRYIVSHITLTCLQYF